jgi:rubredoxin
MLTQPAPHPHHPHELECPRCGRHSVVLHGESRYVCLACGWERDAAEGEGLPFWLLIPAVVLALILL